MSPNGNRVWRSQYNNNIYILLRLRRRPVTAPLKASDRSTPSFLNAILRPARQLGFLIPIKMTPLPTYPTPNQIPMNDLTIATGKLTIFAALIAARVGTSLGLSK